MKSQGVVEDKLVLLKGVSGSFRPGVLTALMGVSGAGKTTLMDVIKSVVLQDVSEVGFQAISEGCRKLQSILFFCQRMTNAAVIAMSNNCPDLRVFRLCIMGRHRPDHVTGAHVDVLVPMDADE